MSRGQKGHEFAAVVSVASHVAQSSFSQSLQRGTVFQYQRFTSGVGGFAFVLQLQCNIVKKRKFKQNKAYIQLNSIDIYIYTYIYVHTILYKYSKID